MEKENFNKDFINDFISESYKSVQEKIEEIENSINELNLDDEDSVVAAWGGYEEDEEYFDVDEFAGEMFDPENPAIEDIKAEFGEEDFARYGSLENPKMITKLKKEDVRRIIQKLIQESYLEEEDELDEERIANPKSKTHVNNLENFIGSHIYGEDLGGLGKMYVAYSYGEQFPVYVNYKGKWYHNTDSYLLDDGEVNAATEKHKEDMRPSKQTHGMSLRGLQSMIRTFKNKHNLGDNAHKDVEPGEKN